MSDWFGTPEKQSAAAKSIQSTPKTSIPSTSALPDRPIRTAAMQDELRQERKKRKKERKQHNQVPSASSISTYINKSGDTYQSAKNGPSTASEGRYRLKEARMRAEENIRNMSAGISTPSIEYIAFNKLINDGFHGIHKNLIGVVAGIAGNGRSRSGDFYLNMIVCDPSAPDSSKAIRLNIFSESSANIPECKPNCIILIRQAFLQRYSNKIQAVGRKGDHTWAVFDPVARRIKTSSALDPQICPEEAQYLDDLSKWWKLINPDVILPSNTGGRKTITISQMQEKVFCNLVAEVLFVEDLPPPGALEMLVTDYTQNEKVKETSMSIHGHRVIKISLYDQQRAAANHVTAGNFVFFNNIRPKMNPGFLEGNLGSDFGRINIHRLPETDERLTDLLKRRQEYDEDIGLPEFMNTQVTNMPSSGIPENSQIVNSTIETPAKRQKLDNETINQVTEANIASIDDDALDQVSPAIKTSQLQKTPVKSSLLHQQAKTILNIKQPAKVTPLNTIKNTQEIPNKYHVKARVIDYAPPISDWAKATCTECDTLLGTHDLVCKECDQSAYITHKYHLSLLLEDERGDILPVYCYDEDALVLFDGLSAQQAWSEKGIHKLKKRLGGIFGNLIDAEDPEDVTLPEVYYDFLIMSYKSATDNNRTAYRVFSTKIL